MIADRVSPQVAGRRQEGVHALACRLPAALLRRSASTHSRRRPLALPPRWRREQNHLAAILSALLLPVHDGVGLGSGSRGNHRPAAQVHRRLLRPRESLVGHRADVALLFERLVVRCCARLDVAGVGLVAGSVAAQIVVGTGRLGELVLDDRLSQVILVISLDVDVRLADELVDAALVPADAAAREAADVGSDVGDEDKFDALRLLVARDDAQQAVRHLGVVERGHHLVDATAPFPLEHDLRLALVPEEAPCCVGCIGANVGDRLLELGRRDVRHR
mmetsp:Transcript_25997/g.50456  ORF Transcript_25997/g.50456 Transcript_25997/m.50456 type:complete len:276 (+) Transcript_25997:208-1035(+)